LKKFDQKSQIFDQISNFFFKNFGTLENRSMYLRVIILGILGYGDDIR